MSGQPKMGIDYAGWSVHIFDDDQRIDELIDAQGWSGFSIYFYLCQKAYATNGYFLRWSCSNSAAVARRMGGGIRSDTVNQVVQLCLRNGLFDKGLFDRESILTSEEIQERYMLSISKRSLRGRTVEAKYWLLKTEDTKDYIVIPENNDSLPENNDSLPENDTKKSKVKKSKEKESITADKSALPSPSEIVELFHSICISYPKVKSLSENRKKAIKARLKTYGYDTIRQVFEKAEASDFMKGKNNRNWSANFDWILKDSNFVKILDGNYDNKPVQQKNTGTLSGGYTAEDYEKIINMF